MSMAFAIGGADRMGPTGTLALTADEELEEALLPPDVNKARLILPCIGLKPVCLTAISTIPVGYICPSARGQGKGPSCREYLAAGRGRVPAPSGMY